MMMPEGSDLLTVIGDAVSVNPLTADHAISFERAAFFALYHMEGSSNAEQVKSTQRAIQRPQMLFAS